MTVGVSMAPAVARINDRPVLQPTCNRVPSLHRRASNSIKKKSPQPLDPLPQPESAGLPCKASLTRPISPKSKSPRPSAIKRGNDLNSSSEKVVTPESTTASITAKLLERKKSKSFNAATTTCVGVTNHIVNSTGSDHHFVVGGVVSSSVEASLSYSSSLITEAPGSIAAVRREQMALQHAQRKMRIAHYGRSKSAKFEKVVPLLDSLPRTKISEEEEKRCSFITSNSGIY